MASPPASSAIERVGRSGRRNGLPWPPGGLGQVLLLEVGQKGPSSGHAVGGAFSPRTAASKGLT